MKAYSLTIIHSPTIAALLILAVLCSTIFSSPISHAQSVTPNGDFLTYQNANYGIKMQYPSDWLVVEGDGVIVSFYVSESIDIIENVNIVTEPVPSSMDLDEYVETSLDNLKQVMNDFDLLESKSVTVAGMQGHQIVYTTTVPEGQFQLMQTFALTQGTGYVITYSAESENYDTYLSTIKTMISSFQIGNYEEEVEFLDYDDSANGISLTYPSNWDVTEIGGGQLVFSSPSNDAIILITFEDSDVSLDGYTKTHLEAMDKDVTFFRIQSESEDVLAGKPAHKIVYTGAQQLFSDEFTELKGMQMWTIIEGRAFIFTYGALTNSYSRYLSTAEQMASSVEIDPTSIPKKISGEYSNEELGLTITFPEGWEGVVTKQSPKPGLPIQDIVIVMPKTTTQQDISVIMIYSGDILDILAGNFSASDPNTVCEMPPSAKITKISADANSNVKAMQITADCESNGISMKTKSYIMGSADNKIIYVMYFATTQSAYDKNIGKFEESIKTVKLEKTMDISDNSAFSSVGGYELSKEKATVKGAAYEVEVLSNSAVSDFSLDEGEKRLSFRVEGEEGTKGSISIDIGKILEPPYTVTLDGELMDKDVMVIEDETTNQTSIDISYSHSIHDISITGTNVVPEFPFPLIFMVAVVIGLLVIAGRLGPKWMTNWNR